MNKIKYNYPDKQGFFGPYGGRIVPPELEERLKNLSDAYCKLSKDMKFKKEFARYCREYIGRPSLLYKATNLSKLVGGATIYLKREDLNHTGAHKINNAIGQALVARAMGAKKLIAETGAGQHGVATATVAALFGFECEIYMGQRDMKNQSMNVYRMKLLGAKVIPVSQGQGTLKDAVDVALGAYVTQTDSYYMLGSAVGPHPYPKMVRDFQSIIGHEAKKQILKIEKRLPDYAVACVGGGSNALGLYSAFVRDTKVKLVAAEPAGKGVNTQKHGLSLLRGKIGDIHGFKCLVLQDEMGEITESYSAASGLDYPGVGPECCLLVDMGRLISMPISDDEAVEAFQLLAKTEGIIPALESAHGLAAALQIARKADNHTVILLNLSGRGDKDVENVCENLITGTI